MEAISNRFRRIYLPLLAIFLVARLFRITAFMPNENPPAAATIAAIPGILVAVLITLYYVAAIIAVLWPRDREAKGEFKEGEPGEWKESI